MRIFMARPEPVMPDRAPSRRWLSIVGIGEDGVEGLSAGARDLVARAEIVFGGARHLALAASLIQGEAKPWPSPFSKGIDAARVGWAVPETVLLSVHGRALDRIRPHLHPGARILALTSDGDGPAALAKLLTATGFGGSQLTVLEALGGTNEHIRTAAAANFNVGNIAALNTVAIDVVASPGARTIAYTPGLADDLFEHDGQITKREIRAVTLSSLAPKRGELLWDVGAGSGSIAIEWMLADPTLRAIAVEARADRAARIGRNAAAFGVPDLHVIEGTAPKALHGLEAPDAIFVGGGASAPGVLDACVAALKPGGRLIANAVTLETEAELLARHAELGGDLIRVAVSRAGHVGGKTGWRPAMPVTQWVWEKA
jgi:precorrin-6Y C5,15-methyltransferase (decarboxylating)